MRKQDKNINQNEPFAPEDLEKIYIKRENKKKCDIGIDISKDADGFMNYFSAPNIRNKIKHPLFLAIRFPECVKIYYNTRIFKFENNEEFIEKLQDLLCQDKNKTNKKVLALERTEEESNLGKKIIVLITGVDDEAKKKRILEIMDDLNADFFNLEFENEKIPEFFQEFKDLVNRIIQNKSGNAYKKLYQKLDECYGTKESDFKVFKTKTEKKNGMRDFRSH